MEPLGSDGPCRGTPPLAQPRCPHSYPPLFLTLSCSWASRAPQSPGRPLLTFLAKAPSFWGKASSHFHLGSEKGKIQCWLQCQVESKYFPFQRCESRLLPIHSRGFSMTIIIACWCFQDILFKVTCKHTHVVDFKIKPLRSQNVKCHSCKCKQGIQIFSFFK